MNLVKLAIFLPLVSAAITAFFATKNNIRFLHYIATIIMASAAVLSVMLFLKVALEQYQATFILLNWIDVAEFKINWALKIDSLSATMIMVVNLVSTVVHCYSLGYMSEDKRVNRFMSYISLFTFFMLLLVTSSNLLQLFVGWEGVGLCSYLLIGFWFHKDSANKAAMKAFIVNRVGDFAFLVGIVAIYFLFGSLEFSEIFTKIPALQNAQITLFSNEISYIEFICMMLFVGCMGKSAQIGLHVWLPDAMEGPTPVSALIHAATMVTAGIFLIVRCSPLFEYAPFTLQFITIIGAVTAIFAATIAITQTDIKRIIAYSTCSQLGYMFFACGVSAYAAGMFHLVTHAFFKALLFLVAGNVILAMHHKNDIKQMGGLWRKLPYTYILVWIGSLAISGIPPFAGYYSKDVILEAAFMSGHNYGFIAYILGVVTVFLTAFYSWRLIYLVFHGRPNYDQDITPVPKIMNMPLLLLVAGAVLSGYIGYSYFHVVEYQAAFWGDSIFVLEQNNVLDDIHHTPLLIKYFPFVATLAGIVMATIYYKYNKNLAKLTANNFHYIYNLLRNKWFIDELYQAYIIRPYSRFAKFSTNVIDKKIIDNLGPNGVSYLIAKFAKVTSKLHSGVICHYALSYIIGMMILLSWILWKIIN